MKPKVWVLIYLDKKHYPSIQSELKKKGYGNMKVCIPTISLLEKRYRGRDVYREVPLLFQYGFLRMPRELAYSRAFLRSLKKQITGIHGFVNSNETMFKKKIRKRVDGEEFDDYSMVATISRDEVKRFRQISKKARIYTIDEIVTLNIGDYVILRGYPFEGVPATVMEVELATNKVKLQLYPEGGNMIVKLPMENVLYSVYHNYDETKLLSTQLEQDFSKISSEDTSNFFY